MSRPVFEGIHYYIQSRGIDLLEDFRTNLDLNGAIGCDNPCDSRCQLIFVETPTGEAKFIYNACGKPDNYEDKKHTGDWDFDDLCTHFSRRGTGVPDIHKERRKKVVGVGWIIECLTQDKLFLDNRCGLWEVIAEDHKPLSRLPGHPLIPTPETIQPGHRDPSGNQQSNRGGQHQPGPNPMIPMKPIDSHINKTPTLAAQQETGTPMLLSSNPTLIDWAKMPPSPPLTAASSMSTAGMWSIPKLFDTFTQDPRSTRSFFVACQNRTEVELSITTHGGMLDSQRDATFIIVDSDRLGGTPPQATLNLLGNLRRSQIPVSPLWIDECVQRGTLVDLDQYTIRTSPTAPPIIRQPKEEKPTDTETPYNRGQKPTDIEVPYKHASVTVASGDIPALETKRRLSQSEVHLADDVVRPTGIIRKAVDPRVRPRPSAERQASNPEISTRPATSISRSVPSTHSTGFSGEKRQLSRLSVYDRPDTTTLNLPSTQTAPESIKDDRYEVTSCSNQVPSRGGNMISHPVRSLKTSFPNAAPTTVPCPQPTRANRPDTPPLPSSRSTSSELPSHDLGQESVSGLDTIVRKPLSPGLPRSLAKVDSDPDGLQRLALAKDPNRSTINTSPSQTSAHDDHFHETLSTSSSEESDYMPSSDDEATPHIRIGGSRASFRTGGVTRSMMSKSSVKSARSNVSGQKSPWTPRRASPSISRARLATLVDELDKWLDSEPSNTRLQFLNTLDVEKPEYGWKNLYYRKRRTVRSLLLAKGRSAATLDQYQLHDVPDTSPIYESTIQQAENSAASPPSLSSAATTSSSLMYTGNSGAVNRRGYYHPLIALGERRLNKLIIHLDEWLHSGFQGMRSDAINKMNAKAPEVGWLNLFHRKGATIRTRLLAMGWLEVVLDEADIVGKPDSVKGPR